MNRCRFIEILLRIDDIWFYGEKSEAVLKYSMLLLHIVHLEDNTSFRQNIYMKSKYPCKLDLHTKGRIMQALVFALPIYGQCHEKSCYMIWGQLVHLFSLIKAVKSLHFTGWRVPKRDFLRKWLIKAQTGSERSLSSDWWAPEHAHLTCCIQNGQNSLSGHSEHSVKCS